MRAVDEVIVRMFQDTEASKHRLGIGARWGTEQCRVGLRGTYGRERREEGERVPHESARHADRLMPPAMKGPQDARGRRAADAPG